MKNLILLVLMFGTAAHAGTANPLVVPPGFTVETLNFTAPNARQMALTENGTLILGTRRAGNVYAVPNALSDAEPQVITLLSDLRLPSGVAVQNGDLYIGAVDRILKVSEIDNRLQADVPYSVITDQLPGESHHGWKYLKFGPDDALYVPVGAPCNICLSADPRFASLLKMDPASGETTIYAHGIRNTVGFDWHPENDSLWITDNGRDMMGDDIPPEELNVATQPGKHFGYPFLHGDGIPDPEFGDHKDRAKYSFTAPALNIQAHSAALGITFYDGPQFPQDYKNAIFIAEHGSWNRTEKVGYKVSVVLKKADGVLSYQPFVTGWLQGQDNWGRPNDVLVAPDGSLLISDDQGGRVYRVRYTGAFATP
ncbi:MAG: PQQ-dependent sugar dehydrogenase [Pseudomonadaceae bacterium]|nr:PQQ-dependent sugar dehydrogenase [Pseudomonadaceae bacterium]